ncbi:MAG TPA: glutamyl-tRNA reductase [Chloroflexota bacterium]|nr:glutamyl-tRNA reductase [Chloroflexota bacterium]
MIRPREAAPLLVVGTSHHLAPVALRERLAKGGERAAEQLAELLRQRVGAAVVLETCNRLEVYCWSDRPRTAAAVVRVLREWGGLRRADLAPYLYVHRGLDAARHLIRVAAGLESLAVGETEVLGQVRAAWHAARRTDPSGSPLAPELDLLFRHAFHSARAIRRHGAFDRHPSVAAFAVEAAASEMGGLAGRTVAVLGAGATGRESLRLLLAAGAGRAIMLNRSRARLAEARLDLSHDRVSLATLDALPAALAEADLLLCATSAPAPVVSTSQIAAALPHRAGRPLTIVDVAVPRDVDSTARALPGVRLLDLDDLASRCAVDGPARRDALERAASAARTAAGEYAALLRLRRVVPAVRAIRDHAESTRAATFEVTRRRLQHLSARDLEIVERLTRTLTRRLVHPPTVAVRRTATRGARGDRERATIVAAFTGDTDALPA